MKTRPVLAICAFYRKLGFQASSSSLALIVAITITAAGQNTVCAGSATWQSSPTTGDWNTASNWTPATVPNGSADTATFDVSNVTAVSTSANTEVNGIVFNSGASAFTITLPPSNSGFSLNISGVGVTNNSGTTQNFVAAANNSAPALGSINFGNSATAGSGNIFTVSGGASANQGGGSIFFRDTSSAGDSTFMVNSGAVSNAFGGQIFFVNYSTAANATLISGGEIVFLGHTTGGTARVEIFGAGDFEVFDHPGKLTIGSLEGDGTVHLADKLAVGSNNLNTLFSGVIQNGSTSGSLFKVGAGTLTLSGANTYSGGTTVSHGQLLIANTSGSGTGSGAVQVNRGTLGGTGIIAGAVTVGTGSSSGAVVLPGTSASKPGTLTINNTLTLQSLSTYKCVLNRSSGKASKVTAMGVTINSNATFTFIDTGSGTLTTGTVFEVINNTSANLIAGTFSNLPDGATFTSNGTTFKASYTGGTGNDLTLTVQ